MEKKYYITAAIPYVNARPHLGHALEFVEGDVLARIHRARGEHVRYISGADENSLKNVQAAEKEGITPRELCDRNAKAFIDLIEAYHISLDVFARSSSKEHFASSQELWERCAAAGDVYKKTYRGLYCVGCELFYTKDELNPEGECFLHPGKKVEKVEEENYFFKLSRYQAQLEKLIDSDALRIVPVARKNEALGFIRQGLEDFSISRSHERARGWGVPVPNDPSQIMYVWFDALNVYRSAAGDFWPAEIHLIGKDILRFHAVYWPAILLSAKLPLPKELLVHGHITSNGQKMSKTLGNVIDPFEVAARYGVDAIRYYLLREIPSTADGDFTEEKLKALYASDLSNGLGNLVARVATLGEKVGAIELPGFRVPEFPPYYEEYTQAFRLNELLQKIWGEIATVDKQINDEKPWEKSGNELRDAIAEYAKKILFIQKCIAPFLPETAEKIGSSFALHGTTLTIKKGAVLFPRLESI